MVVKDAKINFSGPLLMRLTKEECLDLVERVSREIEGSYGFKEITTNVKETTARYSFHADYAWESLDKQIERIKNEVPHAIMFEKKEIEGHFLKKSIISNRDSGVLLEVYFVFNNFKNNKDDRSCMTYTGDDIYETMDLKFENNFLQAARDTIAPNLKKCYSHASNVFPQMFQEICDSAQKIRDEFYAEFKAAQPEPLPF